MAIEIRMPALSPTMEEGTLAKWLVKEGDRVVPGDILAEIETDKATMEFEAADEGTMGEILVAAGTDGVQVGQPIALLLGDGEAATPSVPPSAVPQPAPAPAARSAPRHDPVDAGGRIKASPLARRLAGERGIALSAITASGPGGRVVRADVEAASVPSPAPEAFAPAPIAVPVCVQGPASDIPHERVPLSSMRRTIARRLTQAKQTIPHIYLTVDARLDALLALRAELNARLAARGAKLSVNDLMIKALALALVRNPDCNVRFADDALLRFSRADISVAVSIPGGLITPVVTGAESKSVSAIAQEMKSLAERARDGALSPAEYQGGTASLSNLGMFGIGQFDAVINPPQAMILAVGAAQQRVIPVDGVPAVAIIATITGSFDHRAIDGAAAAGLMADLRALLEDPIQLIA